jgi:hypothetical protein
MSDEKQRFSLKLPEDLLAELKAEAEAKGVSPTSLIEEALRNRHNNRPEIAQAFTSTDYVIKALRLCPECAEQYRMLESGNPFHVIKCLRGYLWSRWGVWVHGKYEDGCPGWEKEANPEELQRIRGRMAEDLLNADATFRSVR